MNVPRTTYRHFGLALAMATLPIFAFGVHAQSEGGGRPQGNNGNRGNSAAEFEFQWNSPDDVTVSSSKDLSHVVIMYCSGEVVKYDDLDVGQEANFSGNGAIDSISAKAGTSTAVSWEPVEHCSGSNEEPGGDEIPR